MLLIKPSDIRYSRDSIRCIFTGKHHGTKIGKTLDGLVDGDISVDTIPCISVTMKNGKWFTHDNRRLWVLKYFELLGGCTCVSVTQKSCLEGRKFTTYNEGTNIKVRGDPGGIWYHKYNENPAIYKNYLQNQNINAHNKSSAPTHARIISDEVPLKTLLKDSTVDAIQIEPAFERVTTTALINLERVTNTALINLEQVTNTTHMTLKRKRDILDTTGTCSRKHTSVSVSFSFSFTPSLSKMPAKPDLRHVFPNLMLHFNSTSNGTPTPSTSSVLVTAVPATSYNSVFSKNVISKNNSTRQYRHGIKCTGFIRKSSGKI
ncbi:hypothetical protein ACJMK2_039118 [Sinanodonta woodiana]|uniref:Uncharacterized protein n=1 Tax=Sinanodonta woodiana TaxID=1069815 RepID=A0ABD3WB13_SINWO